MEPEPTGTTGGPVRAPGGLAARFAARLLDALTVGVAASLLVAILGLPPPTFGLGGLEAWTQSAATAVLWMAYYVVLESQTGTTLGKRLLRLRVVGADDRPPGLRAAALRNVWLLFGLVPLIGGVLQLVAVVVIAVTIGRSDDHRGKHDEIAGTAVLAGPAGQGTPGG